MTEAGRPPGVAVRLSFAGRRGTETERFHGLALLRLRSPATSSKKVFDPRDHVEVDRVIRYGDPFEPPGASPESWADFIRTRALAAVAGDVSSSHLHREFDGGVVRPLGDPVRYRTYFEAAEALARAKGVPIAPRARAVLEDIHHEILSPLKGEAGQVEFQYWADAIEPPAAPPPADEAAVPEGAEGESAPAAEEGEGERGGKAFVDSRPPIPFFPTFQGRAAVLLQPGDVIAPERDRLRQWVVTAVAPNPNDVGSVVIRCRLLGPYGLNETAATEGDLRLLRSILVPLAEQYGPVIGRDTTAEELEKHGLPQGSALPWQAGALIGAVGALLLLGLLRLLGIV